MVVCRFFQQGNCRFGNNCKFEHPRNDFGAAVSPLLRYAPHQPSSNQHAPGPFAPSRSGVGNLPSDVRELFGVMQQEIELAERGGQWPLSCFNPTPSRCPGVIPGLEDHSPEELRFWLYTARALNSVESCNQQIQQLYQQANMKRTSLKIPNADTFSLIETMLRGPRQPISQQSVAQDAWPVASTPSVTPPAPLFGNTTQPTQPAQPAQSTQQMSVFGGPSPFGPQASIFQQTTPFSGNNQASIFGGAALPQPSNFTFALPKQFGSSSAAQPPAPGPFGGQAVASQSIFGGSASQTTPSGGGMEFGQTNQNAQNLSVFGKAPAATTGPFGSSSSSDASLHTPIAELTEQEKSEFTASKFTSGFIPIRPPPKEFCT